MTGHRQYKIVDFRFGLMVAGLREKAMLTQGQVAEGIGVSKRAVQHWEAGTAFPDSAHLKQLIAFFLAHGSFTPGSEQEEIRSLWVQADESAARRPSLLDEPWLSALLAEQAVSRQKGSAPQKELAPLLSNVDWQDAPDIREVFGRESELAQLDEWVFEQKARLVVVLGMGGIGKTTLATQFAQAASRKFEYVIWRSLQHIPSLEELLLDCLQVFSPASPSKPSTGYLLELLQKHRCLLVLDNVETLYKPGGLSGDYREGCEDYRELFVRLANTQHQSCVMLTSRQLPPEVEHLEGEQAPVQVMRLAGLTWEASQNMLSEKSLFGPPNSWDIFVHYYGGNPLALKIVANVIRELFGGDLAAFLKEAPVTLHTLDHLLDNQFNHLSALEREILYWLAIEREPVTIDQLREDISGKTTKNTLLAGLMSLRQRSLIERGEQAPVFGMQPVLLEYVTNRMVAQLSQEIAGRELGLLTKYPLIKSKAREHIRESQARLIVLPVLARLVEDMGEAEVLAQHLREMVNNLRSRPLEKHGFAGGNLVNLFTYLCGHIRGENFSNLAVRQVYLHGIDAQDADFSGVEFSDALFTEPIETIGAMTLSPQGQYLSASSYSGRIHTWRAEDSKPLWTVSGVQREWTMAFTRDETLLATGGFTGEICLWEAASGRLINKVAGHRVWVHVLAFQPDGRRLASGGYYGSVRVWDTSDMSLVKVLEGHTGSVFSIEFTPDGSRLITAGKEGAIRVWDLASGKCKFVLQHVGDGAELRISLHPDGRILASCCQNDPLVRFWDLQTGQMIRQIDTRLESLGALSFAPEGDILACGSSQGVVGVWQVNPGDLPQHSRMIMAHQHYIELVDFAQKGLLATLAYGEGIKLWDARNGKLLRRIKGYSRLIGAAAFSLDGARLVQGDANGMIRIWDLQNRRYLSHFQGHAGPIWRIVISPDGKRFASCADDRLVKVWDLNSLECMSTFTGHSGRLFDLAFSPDGALLASGGTENLIKVWDASLEHGATPIYNLAGSFEQVWSLAIDPQGAVLASGHANGEINLWRLDSGERLSGLHTESRLWGDLVGHLKFSSDGKSLYSTSNNEVLRRWDVASGECAILPASAAGNRNKAIEIGRDGSFVVTGSKDARIYVWPTAELSGPVEPLEIEGHTSRVWTIALSHDERLLASSDEEGTTILSDLQSKTVLYKMSLDRPYERMNVKGAKGLNLAERTALRALGANED